MPEGKEIKYKVYQHNGITGYYNKESKEIARQFSRGRSFLSQDSFERSMNDFPEEMQSKYSDYEDYKNKYDTNVLKEIPNEYITKNCEVPTVIQFIGHIVKEDNKNVVNLFKYEGFYQANDRGLITTSAAIKTNYAQTLLKANKEKNEKYDDSKQFVLAYKFARLLYTFAISGSYTPGFISLSFL